VCGSKLDIHAPVAHNYNPYGCFLKLGFFDGDFGNLIWSLGVLLLFPILVYLVSVNHFAKWIKDKLDPEILFPG
jgi:hypothetical protein